MVTIVRQTVLEQDLQDPREGLKRLREKLLVVTDRKYSWTRLRTARSIPQEGQLHATEAGMYVEARNPKRSKSGTVWYIDIDYTSVVGEVLDPSPLARPAVVTWSSQTLEVPSLFDRKGRPTTNTAGEFLPGLVRRIPLIEYRIRKNSATDPDWIDTHIESTNSDPVKLRGKVRPPMTLVLASASAGEFQVENDQRFTELEMTIIYNPLGWSEEVWNLGRAELQQLERTYFDAAGNRKTKKVWVQVPIVTGKPAKPIEEDVPLDINGRAILDHMQPGTEHPIDPTKLVTLKFEMQNQLPFNGVLPLR